MLYALKNIHWFVVNRSHIFKTQIQFITKYMYNYFTTQYN